jgi:hypothetical protein
MTDGTVVNLVGAGDVNGAGDGVTGAVFVTEAGNEDLATITAVVPGTVITVTPFGTDVAGTITGDVGNLFGMVVGTFGADAGGVGGNVTTGGETCTEGGRGTGDGVGDLAFTGDGVGALTVGAGGAGDGDGVFVPDDYEAVVAEPFELTVFELTPDVVVATVAFEYVVYDEFDTDPVTVVYIDPDDHVHVYVEYVESYPLSAQAHG